MELIISMLGVVASLIAGLLSLYFKNKYSNQKRTQKAEIQKSVAEVGLDLGLIKFSKSIESSPESISNLSSEIIAKIEEQILAKVNDGEFIDSELVKNAVNAEINDFNERIKKIEERFPEEAKLEKISSINDAILSERIDNLSSKIERIGKNILSKWDVAIVVSMIIGGIFAIASATYGVIKYFGSN